MGELNRAWRAAPALALALALAACAKPPGGGLPSDALDKAIGASIGDPTTCVVIAERSSRKILYTYGQRFNCVRGLPACDRPGFMTAQQALTLADVSDGRGASCPSNPDHSRNVGWAEGRIAGSKRDLIYSAVMEGDRALPGQEMMARLADAFGSAGL
jgi:hypothetical protein